jgi:hypothetical protein
MTNPTLSYEGQGATIEGSYNGGGFLKLGMTYFGEGGAFSSLA